MSAVTAARSALFVPGDRGDRFPKAVASGADVVVLDLEDAVAVGAKDGAREVVVRWLTAAGSGVVRINASGTEWFEADCAALAGAPGLLGVMLPKAADPEAIAQLAGRLPGVPLIALIETGEGLRSADRVAAADPVVRLALGTVDLALDLDMDETWESLLLARSQLVLASRLGGLPRPLDGVSVQLSDAAGADAAAARSLGFGGKLCVHPRQVDAVNMAFTPSADQVAWAEAVASLPGGAVSHDGRMVDEPVRARAHRILRLHREFL
jgi:citrate lyase subunit beta/citryl-CoA lyase